MTSLITQRYHEKSYHSGRDQMLSLIRQSYWRIHGMSVYVASEYELSHCHRYGAVFVCLTTRAAHLDLVGDLSTDSFLLALNRFMARRGKPKTIWTDNGTNFIGSERQLSILLKDVNQAKIEDSLVNKGVTWKCNPPSSP